MLLMLKAAFKYCCREQDVHQWINQHPPDGGQYPHSALPFHEFLSVAHFVSHLNQEMPSTLTLAASMVLLPSFTNNQFMLKRSKLILSKLHQNMMRALNLLLKQNHPQIKYFEVLIYLFA